MYKLIFTDGFRKGYINLIKSNPQIKLKIQKSLYLLSENPYHPSLRSHKVNSRRYNNVWSIWVTGDVRIIWDYDSNINLSIRLLSIGGHSGKNRIYN